MDFAPSDKNTFQRNVILIDPVYKNEDGNLVFMDPNNHDLIEEKSEEETFRMAFHIQTVDCAMIYAIFNNDQWSNCLDLYRYICLQRNGKQELYNLLIEGMFDIGISKLCDNYNNITEITSYNSDENSELRLHYTASRSCKENVARHSINWDLFKDIVENLEN
jgi:hypothetical protein